MKLFFITLVTILLIPAAALASQVSVAQWPPPASADQVLVPEDDIVKDKELLQISGQSGFVGFLAGNRNIQETERLSSIKLWDEADRFPLKGRFSSFSYLQLFHTTMKRLPCNSQ